MIALRICPPTARNEQKGKVSRLGSMPTGGIFAFNMTPRWNDPPVYLSRLPENRHALPDEWPSSTERTLLADGPELEIAARPENAIIARRIADIIAVFRCFLGERGLNHPHPLWSTPPNNGITRLRQIAGCIE